MKILHLTLKKRWFDEIASGEKTEEYREIKPYWETRLEGREYDEIHFRNGYAKNAPFMRGEWKGCKKGWMPMDYVVFEEQYVIKLGRILEMKNHEQEQKISEANENYERI